MKVDINKKYRTKNGTPVIAGQMDGYRFGMVGNMPVIWGASGAAYYPPGGLDYDLIEVRTAEEVVLEGLSGVAFQYDVRTGIGSKAATHLCQTIVQALRDEGKLRDGE